MIKQSITYKNFKGEMVTEEHRFHLAADELIKLEVSKREGFSAAMQAIAESEDASEIIKHFELIVKMSYGKISDDGRRFSKTDENDRPYHRDFVDTGAYSQLFVDLFRAPEQMGQFLNGIMPDDAKEVIAKFAEQGGETPPALVSTPEVVRTAPEEKAPLTDAQLLGANPQELSADDLRRLVALKTGGQ